MLIRDRLRRHPVPIVAHFQHSLVLTYALPSAALERLPPPGLVLDTFGPFGLAAVALVQTERLRPPFLPAFAGRSFFLSGYRLFVRREGAPSLRGLYILRSDTDRRSMVLAGNLLTNYRYRLADVAVRERPGELEIVIATDGGEADLHVVADLGPAALLPLGSPFADLDEARRYAGPLPYTFDYEPSTRSIVSVRAVRAEWNPRPVAVDVRTLTFFERPPFSGAGPVLANAFYVGDVEYRWNRGEVHPA